MDSVDATRKWMIAERERRGWSTIELARRPRGIAREEGDAVGLPQQSISNFEQPNKVKKMPTWIRYVRKAFKAADEETREDANLTLEGGDASVMIELLPTQVGAGGGGTGEGDRQLRAFSGSLIRELRVDANDLLLIEIEGDSMVPEFLSGDQMLVNKSKISIAQPGAFCLWDGDGYVVKYLEKIPGSEPPKVRVMSGNDRYRPVERLADEIQVMGRIVWFGRRV
jgi:phage repressor protein C with HTH and peptisase S24 domain